MYEEFERAQDVGSFHLALDPERFVGRDRFAELLGVMLTELKEIPAAAGHDEVLVPGEPEARMQAERDRDGIPLPPVLWESLETLSGELGVAVPRRPAGVSRSGAFRAVRSRRRTGAG